MLTQLGANSALIHLVLATVTAMEIITTQDRYEVPEIVRAFNPEHSMDAAAIPNYRSRPPHQTLQKIPFQKRHL